MRKRKVVYPPPKTATKGAPPAPGAFDPRNPPGRTVAINLDAATGRASIVPGIRVRIASGLYAGEIAVVESVAGGVIPAAQVRTEAGATRRCRTIDLLPVGPDDPAASDTATAGQRGG
ncbi:MAG: hypothetical protein MUE82_10225 [Chloroflexi bacterium]|jgi:hypothetical protein|nr:hypothetical protein [Chloroflexota bacterium]